MGWRWWLVSCVVPSLLFLLFSRWLSESPYFNLVCGNGQAAKTTLEKYRANTQQPSYTLILESEYKERGTIQEVLGKEFRGRTMLLCFIWFAQMILQFGLPLSLTEILILYYSDNATKSGDYECMLNCTTINSFIVQHLILLALIEVTASCITWIFIETTGRKVLIAVYLTLAGVSCSISAGISSPAVIVILLYVARGATGGSVILSYLLTAEQYPTRIRSLGMGMCATAGRMGTVLTSFIAQVSILIIWSQVR